MPGYWTPEDDANLRKALAMYPENTPRLWKNIAKHVPGRTHVQCLQRWTKVLRPGLIKGAWSAEEDKKLMMLVMTPNVLKTWGWGRIAEKIPGRTAKQCRERWRCNLDPSIDKSPWTPEEDREILRYQKEMGNRWAAISTLLPGRTENAIKTRYRSIVRKLKKQWTPKEDKRLVRMRQELGASWGDIAAELPNRTKNGVKVRYKELVPNDSKYARKGTARRMRKRSAPGSPTAVGDVISSSSSSVSSRSSSFSAFTSPAHSVKGDETISIGPDTETANDREDKFAANALISLALQSLLQPKISTPPAALIQPSADAWLPPKKRMRCA